MEGDKTASHDLLTRTIVLLNNSDLLEYYLEFKRLLFQYDITDIDIVLKIIDFYMSVDFLWIKASEKLVSELHCTEKCINHLFQSVSQRWLLCFLQGEEDIIQLRNKIITMREEVDDNHFSQLPLLKLDNIEYQLTSNDITYRHQYITGSFRYRNQSIEK